jgi:hypothetical protein
MPETKIISITIKNMKIEDDKFIIESDDNSYYTNIIKGSINCSIYSSENKIMPLSYLENGDLIKLKLKDNIINKIYVKLKYVILTESSEDYIS